MVNLYRDPNGEKIFDRNNSSDTFESGNISTISGRSINAGTELAHLRKKIREHEESIWVKDRKILELEKSMVISKVQCIVPNICGISDQQFSPLTGEVACHGCPLCCSTLELHVRGVH